MQFSERQVSASSEPLKLLEFALNTVKDAVYLVDSQTRFFTSITSRAACWAIAMMSC